MTEKKKTQKAHKAAQIENKQLLKNIFSAKYELECAIQNFSYATDPTLIDMYSYQIKACQAKYSYLMMLAKKCGLTQSGQLLACTEAG